MSIDPTTVAATADNGATEATCCPPGAHIDHAQPGCTRCTDGVIQLPVGVYDPDSIACPWCQHDQYPDGFPGLPAPGNGHWLIPPDDTV